MSYKDMARRLAHLEAQAAPMFAEEEMSLEEACAAVVAEYSDLAVHEVLALDPVAFLVFLYWTGQLRMLLGWKGVPEFDAWIAQMHGWQPAALLQRLMASGSSFIEAVCALPGGVERAQAAIAAFLPRSHRSHPDHLTYLQKRIKQPEVVCQAT
jgi:hypothetical protein